jgi:hypothetical protein
MMSFSMFSSCSAFTFLVKNPILIYIDFFLYLIMYLQSKLTTITTILYKILKVVTHKILLYAFNFTIEPTNR